MRILLLISLIIPVMLSSCGSKSKKSMKYLALGDSYTIGESVDSTERWPLQLARSLESRGVNIDTTAIIAKTGWTTDELMEAMDTVMLEPPYDMVSLLIGVNNQYRGRDTANYREELQTLLDRAVRLAGNDRSKLFMVSIPDWGVTPFALEKDRDPPAVAREIDAYNLVKNEIARRNNVLFIDITDISREAAADSTLIAHDGLHPSAKMYNRWVDRILTRLIEMDKISL